MQINRLSEQYLCNMGMEMGVFGVDNFPLRVGIIDAPSYPLESIAANYLTCIEGKMWTADKVFVEKSREEVVDIVKWVLKGGHTPSLESVHISFSIENASVVLLKQISRHRVGNSLGVMTQRANAEEWLGKMFDNHHYVTPPSVENFLECWGDLEYVAYMKAAQDLYNLMISKGVQQDEARYHMPQNVTTMWQGTYAYNTILTNICSTRMCHVMQSEAVALAHLMRAAVLDYNPLLGEVIQPICIRSGRCNRNENNPTEKEPKGVCVFTKEGRIPVRSEDKTFDLTQYSKDATEVK